MCLKFTKVWYYIQIISVADPQHFDAAPDPVCHFDADLDPDPACHFDAVADPDHSFQIKAQTLKKC